ncbi:MAG: hypothetical protein QXG69_01480 [Candidatus Caldarchaeum sp.]
MIYIPHFSTHQLRISFGKSGDAASLPEVASVMSGTMLAVVTAMFVMGVTLSFIARKTSGKTLHHKTEPTKPCQPPSFYPKPCSQTPETGFQLWVAMCCRWITVNRLVVRFYAVD